MKKFVFVLLALFMFAPTLGCGGEKEYVEPEGVEDLDMDMGDAPPLPGEGSD